jgi:hypothetical protein
MQLTISATAQELATFVLGLGTAAASPQLDQILQRLTTLSTQEQTMADDLKAKIDDLTTKVQAESTVTASAITLLNGLSAEIAGLKNSTTDPATLAAIDALASSVSSQTSDLAAAVTANTPAA